MEDEREVDAALRELERLHEWVEHQRANLLIITELGFIESHVKEHLQQMSEKTPPEQKGSRSYIKR